MNATARTAGGVPASTPAPQPPATAPQAKPPSVLVVDDDALSRKHLRTVLAFHGYCVQVADSAAQARPLLLAQPPSVVLLDLQMPGENGYQLLAWMRQQPTLAQVPAICVTASVPAAERERVQAAGFAHFVPKPITPPQKLLDALNSVLGGNAPVQR